MDASDTIFASLPEKAQDGTWVGIDLGTTNCACAVWDSSRGRAKLLRLGYQQLASNTSRGKAGRIVPSAVLFRGSDDDDDEGVNVQKIVGQALSASVGQAALNVQEQSWEANDHVTNKHHHQQVSAEDVSAALVTSIKRILGMTLDQARNDRDFVATLPFALALDDDGDYRDGSQDVALRIQPLGSKEEIMDIHPIHIVAILLRSIRRAAQYYLETQMVKKGLQVPGASTRTRNCVVGVPAHFGQAQRRLIEKACRMAGWDGHVSTLTESTAAAMAYGIFVSTKARNKTIMVFDMGGGTTDVTIATMSESEERSFRVVVTEGDRRLGGDDMDEVLLQLVVTQLHEQQHKAMPLYADLTPRQRRRLLQSCRRGKEALCGGSGDGGTNPPSDVYTISFEGCQVEISQAQFVAAIAPLVQRARDIVSKALKRYCHLTESSSGDESDVVMDEVILVGGATRVPAVREMLQQVFPPPLELCCSLNVDGAVAQGAAIQAVIRSGLVPKHELRSALMLDALPHAIGVQVDDEHFIPILEKDATLPAMGYATFALANVHQPGITVVAVEDVGEELPLERIDEFTFLLRRLSREKISKLNGKRTIDVGMTMEVTGKFIVSIFDSNDPEHLRKKQRYQQQNARNGESAELGYQSGSDIIKDETITMEQVFLILASVLLFLMYVGAKVVFSEPMEGNSL